MMQICRLGAIVFTGLVLTVACKKEEEPTINPCMNGVLDPGETAIDCGGSCNPCPATEVPFVQFTIQGTELSPTVRTLTHTTNNGWNLVVGNDSINVSMNLGTSGSAGSYTMSPTGTSASYLGISYPTLYSGIYTITAHNTATQKMSGFFNGKFTRGIAGDTLFVTNGQFEFLPY